MQAGGTQNLKRQVGWGGGWACFLGFSEILDLTFSLKAQVTMQLVKAVPASNSLNAVLHKGHTLPRKVLSQIKRQNQGVGHVFSDSQKYTI